MSFVRSFLIALVVALVVFVPIAYFTVNYVVQEVQNGLEQTTDPSDEHNGPEGDGYELNATGRLSLLLIVTSPAENSLSISALSADAEESAETEATDDPEEPEEPEKPEISRKKIEFMTLVYYNCDSRQVVITAFPGDMMIQLQGVNMSLSDGYNYMKTGEYGVSDRYIADSVTGCTGIPIDCCAYLDISDFERVADEVGGLTVEFSEAFTVYDGTSRFFPKGVNQLTSADLHALLGYNSYSSDNTKQQIITAICKAVLDQESTTANYLHIGEIWAKVSPMYSEYDLGAYGSIEDFANKIFAYRLCTVNIVSLQGGYADVNGEKLYVVDYNGTISQMKQYSR